jgi:hypothetical protein
VRSSRRLPCRRFGTGCRAISGGDLDADAESGRKPRAVPIAPYASVPTILNGLPCRSLPRPRCRRSWTGCGASRWRVALHRPPRPGCRRGIRPETTCRADRSRDHGADGPKRAAVPIAPETTVPTVLDGLRYFQSRSGSSSVGDHGAVRSAAETRLPTIRNVLLYDRAGDQAADVESGRKPRAVPIAPETSVPTVLNGLRCVQVASGASSVGDHGAVRPAAETSVPTWNPAGNHVPCDRPRRLTCRRSWTCCGADRSIGNGCFPENTRPPLGSSGRA